MPAFFHLLFKTLAVVVYLFGGWFSTHFVNIFIICVLLLAADFWTVKNVTGRLMVGLRWNSVVEDDGTTTWRFQAQEVCARSRARASRAGSSAGRCRAAALPRCRAPAAARAARSVAAAAVAGSAARGTPTEPPRLPRLLLAARQEGLRSTSLDVGVFWVGLFAPGVVWVLFGVGSFLRFNFEWLLLIMMALALSFANIVGYVRCKQDARSKIAAGLQGLVARTGMNATMGRAIQSAAGSAFGFGGV